MAIDGSLAPKGDCLEHFIRLGKEVLGKKDPFLLKTFSQLDTLEGGLKGGIILSTIGGDRAILMGMGPWNLLRGGIWGESGRFKIFSSNFWGPLFGGFLKRETLV